MRRWLKIPVEALLWLVTAVAVAWAFGALWFDLPRFLAPKLVAWAWLAGVVAAFVWLRPLWRARAAVGLAWLLILAWWLSQSPRQDRDWKTEVSRTARAEVRGDVVTLHNVRHFDYRSEDDFTPRWETRTVNLDNLRGVDIFITYWGSPYMAHPIISFDFGPDGHICFSIETRPEKGEGYSAIGGFYRQFELTYVVADERDVIRLRTNYRKGEDVYLYRLNIRHAKEGFLEYLATLNDLARKPRWYNAITNNCTTAIRQQREPGERAPLDWRMLVNGYGDQLLYERGRIDRSLPFEELKRRSLINPRARAADADPDFSSRIREGLPDRH
ncbi:MAG: DUF4105 domain-containing protein [Akkermansiaceae bacterium]|jgi:hypothetical protein|nr:DUF4105 domain-containing protein [Akkermansiaceae bacterium]